MAAWVTTCPWISEPTGILNWIRAYSPPRLHQESISARTRTISPTCGKVGIAFYCRVSVVMKLSAASLLRCPNSRTCSHAGGQLSFCRQLFAWALARRVPALHLLGETLRQFLPEFMGHDFLVKPTWLLPEFEKRNAKALSAYSRRFRFFGPLPSFQANLAALDSLRRQVASAGLSPQLRVERRYPCLDRDLLEFLYAIPREQLVRPGQRRSLMRRALVGIVPPEILERRRKGFIARAPLTSIRTELPKILERTATLASSRAGIVDARAFRNFLRKAAEGGDLLLVPVLRTLLIEAWLTHVEIRTNMSIRMQAQAGINSWSGTLHPSEHRLSSAEEKSKKERR